MDSSYNVIVRRFWLGYFRTITQSNVAIHSRRRNSNVLTRMYSNRHHYNMGRGRNWPTRSERSPPFPVGQATIGRLLTGSVRRG